MPLTKIVCTLGPASESLETVRAMIRAGMTVARLNFSHGSHEDKRQMVDVVRQAAEAEGRHVAIMGDLQGPKIRVGKLPKGGIWLKASEEIVLTSVPNPDPLKEIPFPYPGIINDIQVGDRILMDDGALEVEAIDVRLPRLRCRVCIGGLLTSHKGVNLPGVALRIPALTEKDRADAILAVQLEMDYLALSFVRHADDIEQLKEHLRSYVHAPTERETGKDPNRLPSIVAKIEKPEALDELEAIVRVSDAIMVARGDLGVETAPERVPLVQKEIICLCNRLGKPVITATQMLQSMIDSPRPTRAEASDVANAILDGSDAVMLSGETAVGNYPVAAVEMMAKIAENVEQSANFPYSQLLDSATEEGPHISNPVRISSAISRATVVLADNAYVTAILCSTESGRTARTVARHRPKAPLLGLTPFASTARRMQLIWGVTAITVGDFDDTDQMIQNMVQAAVTRGYAAVGSNVVLSAGIPLEVHGVTNMVKVHTVREKDLKL